MARFARSSTGRWVGINVSARVDPFLLRISRGRVSTFAGAPIVNVTVRGRRSGEPRTSALLYFSDGPDVVLIASSFGREKHPAWYHNLKAHPECRLGGQAFTASEVTDDAEYARVWARAEQVYPGYADYKTRVARTSGRRIPVLRLAPR